MAQTTMPVQKIIFNVLPVATIAKTKSIGSKIAENIPKLPTEPIVLKVKNKPSSWSNPYKIDANADKEKIINEIKISFLEKILAITKYNNVNPIIVKRLSAVILGQPQKLPYLSTEKTVEAVCTKNKRITAIWVLLRLAENFPEIRIFIKNANTDIVTNKDINACLLKSKILEVKGRKKTGTNANKI